MDQWKSQCTSQIGGKPRSREEVMKSTLRGRKSGGDRILGGEGMDSPRNPPRNDGGAPNCLLAPVGGVWEKGSPNEVKKNGQGGFILGAPDKSGEGTILVRWSP
jgi:hypothetical protein